MSAYADETLHKMIYNINDTDAFSLYPFFKIIDDIFHKTHYTRNQGLK